MKQRQRSGITAITLLISLVILAVVALTVTYTLLRPQRGAQHGVMNPVQRAKSVECLAQIRKVEMQVQLYSVQNGRYPERLDMLEALAEPDLHCPVTKSRYMYDPQSGRVSCPDHLR